MASAILETTAPLSEQTLCGFAPTAAAELATAVAPELFSATALDAATLPAGDRLAAVALLNAHRRWDDGGRVPLGVRDVLAAYDECSAGTPGWVEVRLTLAHCGVLAGGTHGGRVPTWLARQDPDSMGHLLDALDAHLCGVPGAAQDELVALVGTPERIVPVGQRTVPGQKCVGLGQVGEMRTHLSTLESHPEKVRYAARRAAWAAASEEDRFVAADLHRTEELFAGNAERLDPKTLWAAENLERVDVIVGGPLSKFGLWSRQGVVHTLANRVVRHVVARAIRGDLPPVTSDKPQLCAPGAVVCIAGLAEGGVLPPVVNQLDAVRNQLGRGLSREEKATVRKASTFLETHGWKMSSRSSYVYYTQEVFNAIGWQCAPEELVMPGTERRRVDGTLIDPAGVAHLLEVDGEHHSCEVECYTKPLDEVRRSDLEKSEAHVIAYREGFAGKLVCIDCSVLGSDTKRAELIDTLEQARDLFEDRHVAQIVAAGVGAAHRELEPQLRWETRTCGSVNIHAGLLCAT